MLNYGLREFNGSQAIRLNFGEVYGCQRGKQRSLWSIKCGLSEFARNLYSFFKVKHAEAEPKDLVTARLFTLI